MGIVTHTLWRYWYTHRQYKHKRPTPVALIPMWKKYPCAGTWAGDRRASLCLCLTKKLPVSQSSKVTIRLSDESLSTCTNNLIWDNNRGYKNFKNFYFSFVWLWKPLLTNRTGEYDRTIRIHQSLPEFVTNLAPSPSARADSMLSVEANGSGRNSCGTRAAYDRQRS